MLIYFTLLLLFIEILTKVCFALFLLFDLKLIYIYIYILKATNEIAATGHFTNEISVYPLSLCTHSIIWLFCGAGVR